MPDITMSGDIGFEELSPQLQELINRGGDGSGSGGNGGSVSLKSEVKSVTATIDRQKEFTIPMGNYIKEVHLFELRLGSVWIYPERYTIVGNKVVLNEDEAGIALGRRLDFVFHYLVNGGTGIGGSVGGSVNIKYDSVTATEDNQTVFQIPIDGYAQETCHLDVKINSTWIAPHLYTITGKTITLSSGVVKGTVVHFTVYMLGAGGTGNGAIESLDASKIVESNERQFVSKAQKDKIALIDNKADIGHVHNDLSQQINVLDGKSFKQMELTKSLDDTVEVGIYKIPPNILGSPISSHLYSVMEVFQNPDVNAVTQRITNTNGGGLSVQQFIRVSYLDGNTGDRKWGAWEQIATTAKTLNVKSQDDWGNDFNNANINGMYHVINCQSLNNRPPTVENVGNLIVMSGTEDNSLSKIQYFIPFNNTGFYIRTRGYALDEWQEWKTMAETKTHILTNTLVNGWGAKYGDIVLNVTGNQAVITGTLSCGTLTDGTTIMTVPSQYKPTTRSSHCTIGTFKGDEQGTFSIYTDGTLKYRGGSVTGATDIAFCFTYLLY